MIRENGDRLIGGEQDDSQWWWGGEEGEALSKKENGLMERDNSVVIAGGQGEGI